MRVFLLSVVAVLAVAASAFLVLENYVRRNAGDAFSRPLSTRVSESYKPDPSGALSFERAPTGGALSGRDQGGVGPN